MVGAFIASCSTSNSVVSNHLISKRKYTKGFHLNKKGHFGSKDESIADNDLKVDDSYEFESINNRTLSDRSEDSDNKVQTNRNDLNTETDNNVIVSTDGIEMGDVENDSYVSDKLIFTENNNTSEDAADFVVEQIQQAVPPAPSSTGDIVLAIILCLFIPPLALGIYRGIDNIFWIDLVLFLIAVGGFWFFSLAGFAGLAAVVLAFLGVWDVI